MHYPRQHTEHARVGRTLIDKLDAREPALINLPLPLPSVPVLTPLLSPIIAGNNQLPPANTVTTTVTATPPVQTSSGSGDGSGSSTGGSSGSGSSSGGSSSGGSSSGGSSSGGSSSGGSSSGGSSSGGSSSGGSSSGGSSSGGSSSGGSSSGGTSSGGTSSGGSSNGGSTGSGSSSGDGSSSGTGSSSSGSTGGSIGSGSSGSTSGSSTSGSTSSGSQGSVDNSSGSSTSGSGSSSGGTSGNGSTTSGSGTGVSNSTNTLVNSNLGSGNLTSVSNGSGSSSGTNSDGSSSTGSGGSENVGSDPSGITGSSGSGSPGSSGSGTNSAPGSNHSSSTGTHSGGGGSGSGNPSDPSNPTITDGSAAASKGHISTGAIAAIVVVAVFVFVGLLVIILRRRSIARRSERRRWWFASQGGSYGGGSVDATVAGSGVISARSSFATTYDHARTPRLSLEVPPAVPSLPPMAETRGPALLISLDGNSNFQPSNTVANENRFSTGSAGSGNSDSYSQYLVVRTSMNQNNETGTPMSVRPFSPSESFAFPRPPDKSASGDWSMAAISRPQSTTTFGTAKSRTSTGNLLSPVDVPPTPALPVQNPFADPKISPMILAVSNPFSDPRPPTPETPGVISKSEFAEVETIRRPFIPTLHDELMVHIGDSVRIVNLFDDGWALVERMPALNNAKGKGKAVEVEQGLIPIDCLREAGQDLPEFITTKRVSSYSECPPLIGNGSRFTENISDDGHPTAL